MNYVQAGLTPRGVVPRSRSPIAVIGMSGRYPGGATDLARLWQNLKSGVDGISELRGDRWDLGYHNPDVSLGGIHTRCAGLLDQVDSFDADFFSISPREAAYVDPQQRLLLELAWEALEDAALIPKGLAGSSTGVFIGIAGHDYADMQNYLRRGQRSPYVNSGSALSIAANRISYFFDFRGPSVALDTACSSALVALHHGCHSLWSGDCSLALIGGVNMLLQPKPFVGFCSAGMISQSGRCRSFDAGADGYVRSEGGGVVLLKLLREAERDGDPIKAIVMGSAVGSDGRTAGLSLPNEEAQNDLLRQVYSECDVAAEDVYYVEAHGTGTPVGDPIECKALGRVLGITRRDGSKCLLGSIKSNIGHLEAAAGMAGLTKVLLALQHRELPPNLHFTTPNPRIAFDDLRLQVVDKVVQIGERKLPLVMGLSSYGFGGTNAHVIVSEYRKPRRSARARHAQQGASDHILLLSAKGTSALRAMSASYAELLHVAAADSVDDICATAGLYRAVHTHRLAVSGASAGELAERLQKFAAGEPAKRLVCVQGTAAPRLAYVFSGNGSQWAGMGREVLRTSPAFRAEIERVDCIFKRLAGWSVVDDLQCREDESRMQRTEFAQPALFALQVGIARLLGDAAVRPVAVIGHSVGEVAAAHVAGALSLEQAVRLVHERSRAQAKTVGAGRMAAVGLGARDVASAIADISAGWLEIAAINSERAVTVAGDLGALGTLEQKVAAAGAYYRLLDLDYAFHSRAMDLIEIPFRKELAELNAGRTSISFVSAVAGRPVESSEMDAEYWWRNIRAPVQFGAGIAHLIEAGVNVFLEIGPQPVLHDYIRQCAKARNKAVALISTLRQRGIRGLAEPELDDLWGAILRCHAHGVSDRGALFEQPPLPAQLPGYPWQRQRFWSGVNPLPEIPVYSRRDHPLLGYRLESGEHIWENTIDTALLPYLRDHVVHGAVLMPAAGFIEMALAAAAQVFAAGTCEVEEFEIRTALVMASGPAPFVQLSMDEDDGSFRIRSRASSEDKIWVLHAVGRLARPAHDGRRKQVALEPLRERLRHVTDKVTHYRRAESLGYAFGPWFQSIERIRVGDFEALGEFQVPAEIAAQQSAYCLHPCLLDACLQLLLAIPSAEKEEMQKTYLPVQIGRLHVLQMGTQIDLCDFKLKRKTSRSVIADICALREDGSIIAEMQDVRFVGVDFLRSASLPLYAHFWQVADATGAAADALPLSLLAEGLASQLRTLVERHGRVRHYREFVPRFEQLSAVFAAKTLRTCVPDGRCFTADNLIELGVSPPEQRPYLHRLVKIAHNAGLLEETAEAWRFRAQPDLPDPALLWRELLLDFPAYAAELLLLSRCGGPLQGDGDVKAGQLDAADTTLEHFHDGSPSSRFYNELARSTVARLLCGYPADRRLRILELGGGTGGLTAAVLPLLPPQQTDYLFTDCSAALLTRAAQRFSAYPFVRYGLIDFNRELRDQGPAASLFDLILAGDALHLASDLGKALLGLKELLAAGGMLLISEPHPHTSLDVIFGKLSQGCAFIDGELRRSGPLLAPQEWRALLTQTGFAEVALLSDSLALANDAAPDRSIILAQAPSDRPPAALPARPQQQATLLLLIDPPVAESAFAETMAGALKQTGARVVTGVLADADDKEIFAPLAVRPTNAGDFTRLIAELAALDCCPDEIVHLAGLGSVDKHSCDSLQRLQDRRCVSTLLLAQALSNAVTEKPRLTLVTSRAVSAPSTHADLDPAQAMLWGLGRVLAVEHAELRCRLIDVQSDLASPGTACVLAREILTDDAESEILLTPNNRYVHRLRGTSIAEQIRLAQFAPHWRPAEPAPDASFRLEFSAHGSLDNLFLQAAQRRAPAAGEVEIRVHASGLNFRDVMWVMGMLPDEALENGFAGAMIGLECAGEITRVGPDLSNFTVGDRVIAFAGGCFGKFVTTSAISVARLPANLSFEAGAGIPVAFVTAYYALVHLAGLARGERVLIHGAAGGVGMAALQIAQRSGAEIFATAGTAEKRETLRLLGVDHVLDSRSLNFADDVTRLTQGEGVDVVLNSLAGEAGARNFRILKPFGRVLEIGKRDLYANRKLGLRRLRNNISFFAIDADTLLIGRSELAARLMRELMGLFEAGELRPLPHRSFPVSRAAEAFRQMQQSRHTGKLVITMDEDIARLPVIKGRASIRADGTYLVTGGTSGFGLATAGWLAQRGARHLALVSRRGAKTEEAQDGISALQQAGAVVRVFAADVSNGQAVRNMLADLRRTMPPLRGVIHAAMVLDDGIALNLNRERMHKVTAPKVLGAWNLHEATLGDQLDLFVLYSSVSTCIASPGQANYVTANLFLEALAQYRRARGLPALAVAWGPLAEVGVLARNPRISDTARKLMGMEDIPPADALKQLDALLAADATCVAAARLDWSRVARRLPQTAKARLILLASEDNHGKTDEDLRARLERLPPGERREYLIEAIKEHMARVLGMQAAEIDADRPLLELGLDSLMGVELSEVLTRENVPIPVMELIQSGSISNMAARVLTSLETAGGRNRRVMLPW